MGPSWWQLLIVLVLVVLLFGRGKISELMGDVARGIKIFKTSIDDDEAIGEAGRAESKVIENETPKPQSRVGSSSRARGRQKSE